MEGRKSTSTIKTTVRNRRIDVPAPSEIPDGTEVLLTIAPSDDDAPIPPQEISRVLAAMQELEPFDIPDEIATDLDEWERKLNQRGIEHCDPSVEDHVP